jgi:putative ABC transport system permease protein
MTWWRRLRSRDQLERELDAELRYHFDRQVDDNLRAGMSQEEARRLARLDFGGDDQLKESCRDARGTRWAGDIAQDLRFAARLLLKDRWFTFTATIALALGIGLNGTVFTIVNAMIRGLPIDNPDRFMSISARDSTGRQLGVSYPDFLEWQAGAKTFAGLAAFSQTTTTIGDPGHVGERASGAYLSANTFQLLGEKPILGRDFRPEDDQPGAPAVVILGNAIWKARYNGDPTLIGRTVGINGVPSVVIGVMPDGFRFPVISDVWRPLGHLPGLISQGRDTRALQVFGTLADRRTAAQAQSEVEAIAARLSRDFPDTNGNIGAVVARFPGHFAPNPILIALMVAVGFVLLVACANVANLLLARSAARSREMAIRVSLGATRWRIVQQLFVESALLAGVAGTLGCWFSLAGVWLFARAVADINFPYYIKWTIDGQVLWFVATVCLGTGFLLGLVSALHVSKTAANRSVKEGGRTTTSEMGGRRWTTGLLIAELALTLVLLAGAGLMMRSFLAVYRADLVVDATHVMLTPVTLSIQKYQTPEQRRAFYRRVVERVSAIPGVSSAAFANVVPFSGGPTRQLSIDGRPRVTAEPQPTVSYVTIRGRYFETLGLRLLRGRTFIDTDDLPGHESVIVNQRFVTMFFPNEDPIGRRIRLTAAPQDIRHEAATVNTPVSVPPAWATIVGISPTVRQQYFQDIDPVVYVPDRAEGGGITLIVRARSAPGAMTPLIRAGVAGVDQDVALSAIRQLEESMTQSRWGHRVFGGMLTVFAFVGLSLAAVGLYAVTAYSVVQRTQEIGVRMALGAQAGAVVWLFMKRSMLPLGIGLGIGLPGALGLGRVLQSFLIQTSATDPMTLVGIAVLLTAVSSAACFFPARRATRLDPLAALRYE